MKKTLLALAFSLAAFPNSLFCADQPAPAPTAAPAAAAEEKEASLQKEKIEIPSADLAGMQKNMEPEFAKAFNETIVKAVASIGDARDRVSTIATGLILGELRETFTQEEASALLSAVADLSNRGVKSPIGIGILSCIADDEDGASFECPAAEFKVFYAAISAAQGKPSKEVLPAILNSILVQLKALRKKLLADSPTEKAAPGAQQPDENLLTLEDAKIFACMVGEDQLDAPLFRKPCRSYKPYLDAMENQRKLMEEARKEAEDFLKADEARERGDQEDAGKKSAAEQDKR